MEWISVKDRMPDDWSIVNATDGKYQYKCEFKMGRFYRYVDSIVSGDRVFSLFYTNITHWMPLPDPPKS